MKKNLINLTILLCLLVITACKKTSESPANTIDQLNTKLAGTWTNTRSTFNYYDFSDKIIYQDNTLTGNIKFDGKSTLTEMDEFSSQPVIKTYTIGTEGTTNYLYSTAFGATKSSIDKIDNSDLELTFIYPNSGSGTVNVNGTPVPYLRITVTSDFTKSE